MRAVNDNLIVERKRTSQVVEGFTSGILSALQYGDKIIVDSMEAISDTKIPFETKQIKLLTSGKKHEPQILEWIKQLQDEESDFNPLEIRDNPSYDIADTKFYTIMKNQIERDKGDENIVFFLPYSMVLSVETSIFMQFCSDYLRAIYDRMKKDIDLSGRDIFVIYPSSEKNKFALRNLRQWNIEFVNYNELESYFSYEVVNVE